VGIEAKSELGQEIAKDWLIWSRVKGVDRIAREIGEYYYSVAAAAGSWATHRAAPARWRTGFSSSPSGTGSVRWTAAGGAAPFQAER